MILRGREIESKAPSKKAFADMSLRDRNALREAMRAVEGGIDTAIETECEACGTTARAAGGGARCFAGVRF